MMGSQHHLILGALFICLSELMFAAMGASVKALSATIPTEMIVFFRNLVGIALLLPLFSLKAGASLATRVIHLHLLRASAGIGAMYCFFYVLAHLPLAEGMVLKLTAPIFIPLVALLWLKEKIPMLAVVAIPVGMAGVTVILRPGTELELTALIGVLGGLLAAVAKVSVRRLSHSEPVVRIVFYFALFGLLVSSLPLWWSWHTPSMNDWILIVAVGFFGTVGQLLLTRGYGIAPSARVSPFTYFSVIFASLFGYLFWGEVLSVAFVVGALLIIASGLMALYGKLQVRS